jgi:hypothetical protein
MAGHCVIPALVSVRKESPGGLARPVALWVGTMFCGMDCPDVENIPSQCEGKCDLRAEEYGACVYVVKDCPCATPITIERLAAFVNWVLKHEKDHPDPVIDRKMAARMGHIPSYHLPRRHGEPHV